MGICTFIGEKLSEESFFPEPLFKDFNLKFFTDIAQTVF